MNIFDVKDLSIEELKELRETDSMIKNCFIFTGQGIQCPVLDDYDFFFSDDEDYKRVNINNIDTTDDEDEEDSFDKRAEKFYYEDDFYNN